MTDPIENWYIVKHSSEHCEILSEAALPASQRQPSDSEDAAPSDSTQWGPFQSKNQAIAKRVGLIRAGKCQPQ